MRMTLNLLLQIIESHQKHITISLNCIKPMYRLKKSTWFFLRVWFNCNLQETITRITEGWRNHLVDFMGDCYFYRPRNLTEADYANPVTNSCLSCLIFVVSTASPFLSPRYLISRQPPPTMKPRNLPPWRLLELTPGITARLSISQLNSTGYGKRKYAHRTMYNRYFIVL